MAFMANNNTTPHDSIHQSHPQHGSLLRIRSIPPEHSNSGCRVACLLLFSFSKLPSLMQHS